MASTQWIAPMEDISESIPASKYGPAKTLLSVKRSSSFNTVAPPIAGMDRRKENSAALAGSTFDQRPAEMVDPDLEIPGKIAQAWAKPIMRPVFRETSDVPRPANLVESKIRPVPMRKIDV